MIKSGNPLRVFETYARVIPTPILCEGKSLASLKPFNRLKS